MRLTHLALISTSLVFAIACRGGSGDDQGDDTPPMDAPPGGTVTIMQIQDDAMPPGTQVTVKGVVVTAIDAYGDRTGDLFVQDPAGGPFSGVKVFGAPLDVVATLAPGDLVDISNAEKDEFALTSDMSGRKVTELKPVAGGTMSIVKKGTGTVPAPAEVDAKAIAALDKVAREAEWEKWEGVLIKVTGARQIATERAFGTNPGVDSNEFRITGIARVQSLMAALPEEIGFGVCYESITGIGDYFFSDLVVPRTTADVVPGGTDCRPMATTVVEVQTGTNPEVVSLTNVVVTGRDDIGTNSKGFWVADALQSAVNAGVFVFTRADAAPATYVIGALVNVQGGVTEFDLNGPNNTPPSGDTLTQIIDSTHSFASAPAGLPVPLAATAAEVSDIGATGEPYEGVLVQLSNVKVTNVNAGQGKVELTDNDNAKVIMDDDSFSWPAQTANKCYATLTGIMSVQVVDNIRTINPRALTDFVDGVGCN